MSALLPAESMALTVARAQVERGDASNIQAVLVLTVERLAAEIQAVRELRNRIIAEWPTDTVNIGVVIGLLDDALEPPLTDNDALNQTRDALHIAFTLIANARNSLDNNVSNRDPVLADQWHEAAARFMQDYNANLDVYTGYRVSGRNECPTCSGPVRETVGMVCQTCGTDYGKEPCGEECGNSVHMHRCQITDGVPHDHICYDCGYTWTDPTESTLWKCDDCGGMFFDRESHACPNAIERLDADKANAATGGEQRCSTAMYDDQGRFLGHSIEVEHHTTGNRAWSLGGAGVNEWCYPDSPCDSCQRARMGDPWEIIQRVRELHILTVDVVDGPGGPEDIEHCQECGYIGVDAEPCPTIRILDGGSDE